MAQAVNREHGAPVFRGTRVPVQTLFDYLGGGDTLEEARILSRTNGLK
jgi:uncharacterized protein (DUF433 family)